MSRAGRIGWVATLAVAALAVAGRLSAEDADCLRCHADPEVAQRDAPDLARFLVDTQQVADSVHNGWECIDCHEDIDPEASPHRAPEERTPVDCLSCHDPVGESHRFHPRLALEDLPDGDDTRCTACHGSHDTVSPSDAAFAFQRHTQVTACGACHEVEAEHFAHSAHGRELLQGTEQAPDCLSCHSEPEGWRNGEHLAERKITEATHCESCHVQDEAVAGRTVLGSRFVASFAQSVHGSLLLQGREDSANCVDCHGAHEMNRATVSDAQTAKVHVAETCAKCHEEIGAEFDSSVHAAGLARGNLDSPTCTDCHGEHNITEHTNPLSPVYERNVAQQVCASCHSSVRLTARYGLASNTFETFADSYHGLAMRGGAVEVVNCASCHAAHAIKSHLDPTSTVHRDNLLQTCGECHPGANERFAQGRVHVQATADADASDGERLLYWISTIYTVLIVVVIGGMLVHNGLDFTKKLRRKLAMQKGLLAEPHVAHRLYLRMTVHERLQHAVLVISFMTLVVTGFMLRYPEAWWVVALGGLSENAFELRGWIHRIAGVALIGAGIWHLGYLGFTTPGRSLLRDLWPRWRDVTDPWKVLRYNLGLARTKPQFGRFSYIEKTEYWAMMWGSVLMALTGVVLWFENTSMGLFSKTGYDVARTVHYFEAILATLAILVWHFYFVIFNPDVYPMNLSWLTGRMSEREMMEEHPEQLKTLRGEAWTEDGPEPAPEGEPDDAPK